MQMRVRVSAREAKVLAQYFDALRIAEANFKNAEANLLSASSMVLARKKIPQALVDDIDDNELLLTVPDAPAELQDTDRQFLEKCGHGVGLDVTCEKCRKENPGFLTLDGKQ